MTGRTLFAAGALALVLALPPRDGQASPHCPPLPPPASNARVDVVDAGDTAGLVAAVRGAIPGSTISIEDGIYRLPPSGDLIVRTPNVTIRSASGDRGAVVIEGARVTFHVYADDVTIADLTVRGPTFHAVQVHGEVGLLRPRIYNVHALDAGQQIVKVSTGPGTAGKFADYGEVACSLIEYTTHNAGTGSSPGSYTNGIDVLAGMGWIIRDNTLRRIRSEQGPSGPAILVWRSARDTEVRRNLIVDSWRGIALGLGAPSASSRGGAGVTFDHENGVVENNVFLALSEPADAAFENSFARNTRVVHNTAWYNPDIRHAVGWSIEYRWEPTTLVVIENNLVNRPIVRREPQPRGANMVRNNVVDARREWFEDIEAGDFRLRAGVPAVDSGRPLPRPTEDFDGEPRIKGAMPDAGADEL